MIAWTSRLSLRATVAGLRGLQREVYEVVRQWPGEACGPSLQELAVSLRRKECSICGRLQELRQAGCIEDAPLKQGDCGKPVKSYRALVWREPLHHPAQMALSL